MNKAELAAIRYRLRTWDTGATALRDFVEHAVEDIEALVEAVDLIVDEDDDDVTKALAFARAYDIDEARKLLEACDGETVEDVRAALALIATDSPAEVARLVELGRKVDGYDVDAMTAAWKEAQ